MQDIEAKEEDNPVSMELESHFLCVQTYIFVKVAHPQTSASEVPAQVKTVHLRTCLLTWNKKQKAYIGNRKRNLFQVRSTIHRNAFKRKGEYNSHKSILYIFWIGKPATSHLIIKENYFL